MPPAPSDGFEQKRIDPRLYLGIIVFRWKVVVACFLYCLLTAVLYLVFTPKRYATSAQIMIYRDPATEIVGQEERWQGSQTHVVVLRSQYFREKVMSHLVSKWGRRLGDAKELMPPVSVGQTGGEGVSIQLSIQNTHPAYARAYLNEMIREFQKEREVVKAQSYGNAAKILEEELVRLDEQIKEAEDAVIEFQRVNQMEFVQAKGALEQGYLGLLVGREHQLNTERWLMDIQFPRLKGGTAEFIRSASDLTRETGAISASGKTAPARTSETRQDEPEATVADIAERGAATGTLATASQEGFGLGRYDEGHESQDLRVQLARLAHEKKNLIANMQPDHPKIRAMDEEIQVISNKLEVMAEVEFAQMKERYDAITLQTEALQEAQRRWKNSYYIASKKNSDFRHMQMLGGRLEGIYGQFYTRLNDMRIDREIKGEHFAVVSPVRTQPTPVWPDSVKILIAALVTGIGSGLGLAMLMFVFDNKVQSISDVEAVIGVPFLGGVPYWVHSDLVARIRPIVSEQHKSGAAEAYRSLRTSVLAALDKVGKKVILITSADSKEGKTLTALNLAIMMAKTGKRVLLLDMDLRRGVLHKSLEKERSPGIVNALKESRPLSSVVQSTPHENLWFAPAGAIEKNTSELLHATNITSFLGEVAEMYDYVIMDSAPVLRVTDTVILASCPICSVIYVAHANRTSKPIIRYSLDMLGDVHIIGLIINSIEMHRISSLYYTYQYPNYAYYSYAYAYGYDYDLYDAHGRRGRRRPGYWAATRRSLTQWARRMLTPLE